MIVNDGSQLTNECRENHYWAKLAITYKNDSANVSDTKYKEGNKIAEKNFMRVSINKGT